MLFGGIEIGTLSANVNGIASTWTLEIDLNGDADAAAVSALVNAIAYENSNGSSSGTRIVDFVLEDGDGGTSNVSSVTVNVAANMAPDSNSIREGFTEDTTAEITVSGTDSDGSVAEIRILTLPENGELYTDAAETNLVLGGSTHVTTDGSLTLFFVPNENFDGDTSFEFAAIDDQGLEGPAAVKSLEGTAVNDAPVTGGLEETYLADLTPLTNDGALSLVANAGHNNAEININGQTFFQGIGIHPTAGGSSVTEYDLNGATSFTATAGVSETISGSRGRVSFRIFVDGVEVFDSGLVTNGTPAIPVSIDTTGGSVLRFEVDAEGGQGFDHFVLADAVLTGGVTQPTTISVAESAVDGTVIGTYEGSDPDVGDTLTYTLVDSAGGRFAIDPDTGVITVADSSQLDFESTDSHSIVVRIDDGMVTTDDTVTINLTDVNEAPTGTDNLVSLLEDGSHSFSVADFGFADSEGDTLNSIRIESLPIGGTLTLNGVTVNEGITIKTPEFPNLVYTPAADFNGSDSFDFTVEDLRQKFAINSNTLTFDVVSVNDDPVAGDDFGFTTAEDTPITIALSDLLANDSDADGDILQIDAFGGETNGTVQSNGDGTYTFTPDANFSGVASFEYIVNDGNNGLDTGTVEIIVGPANDDPVAVDDEFTTLEDTSVTILPSDLLANDSDPDGDTPQFVAVDANSPTNGTLQVNGDGSFTYTPNANFFGTDSFTYGITDGNGGTAQATVNITVTSVNDAPTISPVALTPIAEDSGTVTITQNDLLVGADDVEGDPLSAVGLTITSGSGTLVDNLDGTWDFTPDANDDSSVSFSYDVTDGSATVANTATLDITPVNDDPTAVDDLGFVTQEDTPITIALSDLLSNDSDIDGDTLDVRSVGSNTGTVMFNADDTITFTPDANFNGVVVLTYFINDGNGGRSEASIEITVEPVNDAPTTAIVTLAPIAEDSGTVTITQNDLLVGADDVEGDPLSAVGLTITSGSGTLVDNLDGTWDFTPRRQ